MRWATIWYRWLSAALVIASLCGLPTAEAQDQATGRREPVAEARLGLADLPAAHAALSGKAAAEPPRDATFLDLWNHPDDWHGRRVRIRGRTVRIFRQDAVGDFPPLTEAWLSTPEGNLLCTLFPSPSREPHAGKAAAGKQDGSTAIGREVTFAGTFLKLLQYQAADQPRLVPLIVGDRPPSPGAASIGNGDVDSSSEAVLRTIGGATPSGEGSGPGPSANAWPPLAWGVGLTLGAVALAVLISQHLRAPAPRRDLRTRLRDGGTSPSDPRLEFIETEAADGADSSDA